jgi:hypothetical protein
MAIPRFLKRAIWVTAVVVALVIGGVVLLVVFIPDPSKDEVVRVNSPNGKLDAVLIEANGGATTSFGYEVHIVPRNMAASDSPVAFLYGALRNKSAYGVNLRWDSPSLLAIEFLNAKSAKLEEHMVLVADQNVRVVMREGVLDLDAPAGGMAFNIRRSK